MAANDAFHVYAETPHRHEAEALEWLRAALPSHAPYSAWVLFAFDTDDGRRYEVDALVLTAHVLYVLEVKSWRGRIVAGDARSLTTEAPGRGREVLDHPLPLLEAKAKSLVARVRRVARTLSAADGERLTALRFEPLVWLSHAESSTLDPNSAARSHVIVGVPELHAALRRADFPGAHPNLATFSANREAQKALGRALAAPAFGLSRSPRALTVLSGKHRLGSVIEEGRAYQDRWTDEPNESVARRRVRSYLLPRDNPPLARDIETRAAREATTLLRLGEHPDILALDGFDPAGPLGPALVFRGFDGVALDRFVARERDLSGRSHLTDDDRLAILQRVAHALAFCHRKNVVHGALSPAAVLVRRLGSKAESRDGTTDLDVKLTRFAFATSEGASTDGDHGLLTRLGGSTASVYEAPEVTQGARPSIAGDLFSLGALAYYLFAGAPPAPSPTALAQRLARDGGLCLSAARPGTSKQLEDALFGATSTLPELRLEEVRTPVNFYALLEDALTAAEPPDAAAPPQLDPLAAKAGDTLGAFRVKAALGTGATARVLHVVRDSDAAEFALKVPLSDAHHDRITAEAGVLTALAAHTGLAGVAQLVERLELAGRPCLLIEFAGDNTLADQLRAEGALSLEFARRWGDELLLALRGLEEAGVQHRDIKPANIGLTTGAHKQRKRLVLFDFSLSAASPREVNIGTPAYKDPGILARGQWDDAADRWAAAVVLYEMFAGTRPVPDPGAAGPDALAVRLEPERLDADVRDALSSFFQRAFRRDPAARFASADDMRNAFLAALHRVADAANDTDDAWTDALAAARASALAALRGRGPAAGLGEVPLPTRARNAIDRMGLYTLADLAQLRPNWLNGVRGVGTKTASFVVALAGAIRDQLDATPPTNPDDVERARSAFEPAWRGRVASLDEAAESRTLSPAMTATLADAGLADAALLASAPEARVKNLVKRARGRGAPDGLAQLRQWLASLVDAAPAEAPSTLRAAVDLLVPPAAGGQRRTRERTRRYFGVSLADGPPPGDASALARADGITRQAVSIELVKLRRTWQADEHATAVLLRAFAALRAVLDGRGGMAPLSRALDALVAAFPPESDLAPAEVRAHATALVRLVAHVDASELGAPRGARLRLEKRPTEPIVALDAAAVTLAERLGDTADALVDRGGVLSEAAAAERLRADLVLLAARESVPGNRLADVRALDDRSLVGLAAAASANARVSARGELYPRGLSADRAVLLSAPALQGELSPEEIQRRVQARYPECAAVPGRKALDDLLAPLRVRFSAVHDRFVPEGSNASGPGTELYGRSGHTSQLTSASRRERAARDVPGASALRVFEEELQRAASENALRVLLWRGKAFARGRQYADHAPEASQVADAIARTLGGTHASVDAWLLDAARTVAAELGIRNGLSAAFRADAAGPASPTNWARLGALMRSAAERLEPRLDGQAPPAGPWVLTHLGLLARYGQLAVVSRAADRHRRGLARAACFLVLPVYAGERAVVQVAADVAAEVQADPGTGLVTLPGIQRHELLEVPAVWVDARTRDTRGAAA